MASVMRRVGATQRGTCRPRAHDGCEFGDRLINHHVGSPPVGSALPVASCSSSAESFRCTSMTR
jgi:hypothetical protein